jgi:hypothetical protein
MADSKNLDENITVVTKTKWQRHPALPDGDGHLRGFVGWALCAHADMDY